MVLRYSWYTFTSISWQEMQNCSVLVHSMTVLKPPQKMMPSTKARPTALNASPIAQVQSFLILFMARDPYRPGAGLNAFSTRGLASVCGT